ncbi:hypothetical protein C8Q78DRAFT_1007953 [Trametes maxima]|nr:hypothetical protein C8Q78DRAFT_1007953 [Trametes maxima]
MRSTTLMFAHLALAYLSRPAINAKFWCSRHPEHVSPGLVPRRQSDTVSAVVECGRITSSSGYETGMPSREESKDLKDRRP